jgi:glutathione S-transferase
MFSRAWNSRAASKIAALSSTRSSARYSTMAPLTLYSWPTPNGIKASITLEELGINYKSESNNISTNIQKEE